MIKVGFIGRRTTNRLMPTLVSSEMLRLVIKAAFLPP